VNQEESASNLLFTKLDGPISEDGTLAQYACLTDDVHLPVSDFTSSARRDGQQFIR
jgi:hypothetical protein